MRGGERFTLSLAAKNRVRDRYLGRCGMRRRLVQCCLVVMVSNFWGAPHNAAAADERDPLPPTADGNQPAGRLAKVAEGAIRRKEPGFRALYTMNRDGTNVEYLTAAPGMIASGSPEW